MLVEQAAWLALNHQDEAQLQNFVNSFPHGIFRAEALRQIEQIRRAPPERHALAESSTGPGKPPPAIQGDSSWPVAAMTEATVCIFESAGAALGSSTHFYMDGVYIGAFRRGRYSCISAKPGPHSFSGRGSKPLRVDLKPSGIYYIEAVTGFHQYLRLDEYNPSISKLNQAESTDIVNDQHVKWVAPPWLHR